MRAFSQNKYIVNVPPGAVYSVKSSSNLSFLQIENMKVSEEDLAVIVTHFVCSCNRKLCQGALINPVYTSVHMTEVNLVHY